MDFDFVTNLNSPLLGRLFSGGHVNEQWAVYIGQAPNMTPLLTEQVIKSISTKKENI